MGRRRWGPWIGGVVALGCAVAALLGRDLLYPRGARGAESPDIVFLVVETFRADRVRLWGGHRHTMPNVEDLAAEGIVFQRAIAAAPWTLPSVSSILTGLAPSAHGVTRYEDVLPGDAYTLAERLGDAGYETAFFGVNSLFEAQRGVDQGFQTYYGIDEIPGTQLLGTLDGFLRHRTGDRPLFLYIHLFEPHCRYQAPDYMQDLYWPAPPEERTGRRMTEDQFRTMHECFQLHLRSGEAILDIDHYLAAYDAELRYADHLVGLMVERLKSVGIFDKALVVLTGDHGEEFWEKGDFGHGRTLHEAAVRVPLIIRPPGGTDAPPVDAPISLVDLAPTALKAAGLPLKPPLQGLDLSPLWTGGDRVPLLARPVFTETDYEEKSKRAVYLGGEKLTLSLTGAPPTLGSVQDPDPEGASGALPAPLTEALRAHRTQSAEIAEDLDVERRPLRDEDVENLRRLGYLE